METVGRLYAMASLCRQSAAYHPDGSWKLLVEAEYWGAYGQGYSAGAFQRMHGQLE